MGKWISSFFPTLTSCVAFTFSLKHRCVFTTMIVFFLDTLPNQIPRKNFQKYYVHSSQGLQVTECYLPIHLIKEVKICRYFVF